MAELEKLSEKYVISYCEIPEELTEKHWISEYMNGCFIEVHLDDNTESEDKLDKWIRETYPFLINEESFLIEIDY